MPLYEVTRKWYVQADSMVEATEVSLKEQPTDVEARVLQGTDLDQQLRLLTAKLRAAKEQIDALESVKNRINKERGH